VTDVSTWANLASGNNAASPDGFPEGQSAGSLNDSGRETMAAIRRYLEDGGWFDGGYTPTFVSFSTPTFTFSVAAPTQVAHFQVGRRLRIVGSLTGTLYGVIATSVFSSVTTVTVTMDSGTVNNETLVISAGLGVTGTPGGETHPLEVGMKFLCKAGGAPANGLWTIDATVDDHVPIIKNSYGDTGNGGSWVVSGMTNGNTGSGGTHNHSATGLSASTNHPSVSYTGSSGAVSAASGNDGEIFTHSTAISGSVASGGSHSHSGSTISSSGAWRPPGQFMVILEYTG
jgi:hypothetical protein